MNVYHFAIPCDNFSIAHTTPNKIRNLANPLGWNHETEHANRIMRVMIRRIQLLAGKGACIIVEWQIPEVQGLTGSRSFEWIIAHMAHHTRKDRYGLPIVQN